MSNICPSATGCPIFNGLLKDKKFTTDSYKKFYCEAGYDGRSKCKRWLCNAEFEKVPKDLLLNSIITLSEIKEKENW